MTINMKAAVAIFAARDLANPNISGFFKLQIVRDLANYGLPELVPAAWRPQFDFYRADARGLTP